MSGDMHTPAPWRVSGWAILADSEIGTHHSEVDVAAYGAPLVCESVRPENRSLIAAAPEMLDALREARDGLRYWEPQTTRGASECARICALVEAAIAKATGGTP